MVIMEQVKQSHLIHGCDIISWSLKRCLIPVSLLYEFNPKPPHRPKPLPILVVLANCLAPVTSILSGSMMVYCRGKVDKNSVEYRALAKSVFITTLAGILGVVRTVVALANTSIVLAQHGTMSNVIASGNNYVSEKDQTRFGRATFAFLFVNVLANVLSYMSVFSLAFTEEDRSTTFYILLSFTLWLAFLERLYNCSALMYTCYLARSLGKHVENFSIIYVDTMFDQFMKAIEKEDNEAAASNANPIRSLPFFEEAAADDAESSSAKPGAAQDAGYLRALGAGLRALRRALIGTLSFLYNGVMSAAARLNSRRYPELPEMKMTKLSSTNKLQISETMRVANNHLIRVRLRRTQLMLSELRDLVSDINKTSSPLFLIYLTYETCLVIIITTASVQARVYKSLSLLILPTITVTLGLISSVVYICICYDETTKQLQLLINKLFDFIIMNLQAQSTGKRAIRARAQIHANDSEVCIMPGSEAGAINETWSQFQYTRKLANTIQFTMGGILPVTRRLVMFIQGHILSFAFIAIEIMSIIDSLYMADEGADKHPQSWNRNATSQHNHTLYAHHHNQNHHRNDQNHH